MCGIWDNSVCTMADSCNVYGHDFVGGDCVHCGDEAPQPLALALWPETSA